MTFKILVTYGILCLYGYILQQSSYRLDLFGLMAPPETGFHTSKDSQSRAIIEYIDWANLPKLIHSTWTFVVMQATLKPEESLPGTRVLLRHCQTTCPVTRDSQTPTAEKYSSTLTPSLFCEVCKGAGDSHSNVFKIEPNVH